MDRLTVLVVGATGSIGRLIVEEAVRQGHRVRALVRADASLRKTFELVAIKGPAQDDLDPLFAPLDPDVPGALDAVHDLDNMPLAREPQRVRDDLESERRNRR